MRSVKTLFICYLFACLSLLFAYSFNQEAKADTMDITKIIDEQIEQKEQEQQNILKQEKQDDKITIGKEELMKLIDSRIKEKNNKYNNKDNTTNNISTDKEKEIRNLVHTELQKQNEKEMLNAIQQDKTDNNNIDTSGYKSKTDKYNKWNVNFGTTLYYNPRNKIGLNAGLTLDLYYRWKDYGFLIGVDGIWHNVISGDYRKFKSDNYGEAGEIRERYSILFKTGFISFINDNWSLQFYMLLGWGNANVKVWDINGYGTSLNHQSYVRGGLGLKVVYKRIYMGITWLAGAPSNIHYTNASGEDVIWNLHYGTRKKNGRTTQFSYTPTEHNVLFSFGVNIF